MLWSEWDLDAFLEWPKKKQILVFLGASMILLWLFYTIDWSASYRTYRALQEQQVFLEQALSDRYAVVSAAALYEEQQETLTRALHAESDQWVDSNEKMALCLSTLSEIALEKSLEVKSMRVLPEDKQVPQERKIEMHLSGHYEALLRWIFQISATQWLIRLDNFQLSEGPVKGFLQLRVIVKLYERKP